MRGCRGAGVGTGVITQSFRRALPLLLFTLLTGCQDSAAPEVALVLPTPPDMVVIVFQSTHENFYSPVGYVSQYAVWIGSYGVPRPEAGVVVSASTPVFIRERGGLTRATGAAINPGDVLEVWRDASVAYGAVQAPPGAPCYRGLQVVISRM